MRQRNEAWEIIRGILLLIGMHFAAFLAVILLLSPFIIFLALKTGSLSPIPQIIREFFNIFISIIGLPQLIYVIPIVFWLKRRQRWGLMKGVIIGAILTALLNGGCFLWLFLMSR